MRNLHLPLLREECIGMCLPLVAPWRQQSAARHEVFEVPEEAPRNGRLATVPLIEELRVVLGGHIIGQHWTESIDAALEALAEHLVAAATLVMCAQKACRASCGSGPSHTAASVRQPQTRKTRRISNNSQ